MSNHDTAAVEAALCGNWNEAVRLNEELVQENGDNTDVLNRLAYAYAKCGKFDKACKIYQQVLSVDPYNPLAVKNYSKFKQLHTNHI